MVDVTERARRKKGPQWKRWSVPGKKGGEWRRTGDPQLDKFGKPQKWGGGGGRDGGSFSTREDKEAERNRVNQFIQGRREKGSSEPLKGVGEPLAVSLKRGSFGALSEEDKAKLMSGVEAFGEDASESERRSYFLRTDVEEWEAKLAEEKANEEILSKPPELEFSKPKTQNNIPNVEDLNLLKNTGEEDPFDMDTLHGALDVAGLTPAFGIGADLLNAAIYASKGDKMNTAISLAAAIPIAGIGVGAGKIAGKAGKTARDLSKVGEAIPKMTDETLAKVYSSISKTSDPSDAQKLWLEKAEKEITKREKRGELTKNIIDGNANIKETTSSLTAADQKYADEIIQKGKEIQALAKKEGIPISEARAALEGASKVKSKDMGKELRNAAIKGVVGGAAGTAASSYISLPILMSWYTADGGSVMNVMSAGDLVDDVLWERTTKEQALNDIDAVIVNQQVLLNSMIVSRSKFSALLLNAFGAGKHFEDGIRKNLDKILNDRRRISDYSARSPKFRTWD